MFSCTARESTEGTFISHLHPVELHPNQDIHKMLSFIAEVLQVHTVKGFACLFLGILCDDM